MTTRKIIDIEHNGEKVWPKGHAKATFMSDGTTVEDAINQIGTGGGGGITVETDPIFSASPAATITEEKKAEWDGKYAKPSGGIPKSDLSAEVQGALRDALAYKGTVTQVKINGSAKSPNDGEIDLGTVVTSEDIEDVARLDEEYVVANGIVSKQDVYYHLPDITTDDTAHTLATKDDVSLAVETYIADFTMGSLREGMNNGSDVNCDIQALVAAMNANKIILVRDDADSSYKGVYVLNGYAEDLLYFSIVDTAGNVLYCDGTDYVYTKSYINVQTLFYRNWFDKQDTLVSGENIKTINGESVLGSGDITIEGGVGTITGVSANGTSIATSGVADIPAASTSKYGVTKLTTLTNSSSTTLAATASAVKIAYDLANSKQDRLESGTNIKTINGASILGSGDITISGGTGTVGPQGPKGDNGADGATFTPSVDSNGNLSWTNNKGLANPPTVNIKGPKGDAGEGGGGSSGGEGVIQWTTRYAPDYINENNVINLDPFAVYYAGFFPSDGTILFNSKADYQEWRIVFYIYPNCSLNVDVDLWVNGITPDISKGGHYELSVVENDGAKLGIMAHFSEE